MKKNLLTSAQKKWLKKYFKSNNIHLKISNLEGLAHLLKPGVNGDYCRNIMGRGKPFITISVLSETKKYFAKSKEN